MTADRWGIEEGFEDALGRWQETPEATRSAILCAMGAEPNDDGPSSDSPVRVLRPGETFVPEGPAELTLEDGTIILVREELPPVIPFGYHVLQYEEDGRRVELIVSPGRCHLPADLRLWGWALQLYSLRSQRSWGMGDLGDLRMLAEWAAGDLDAGLLLTNPLHAASPIIPQSPSPYFPTSRIYKNLLYLRVEEIPGAGEAGADLERLAAAGRDLNRRGRIDRDAIFRLKFEALQKLWAGFKGDPRFEEFVVQEGEPLSHFAIFCVLAQRHGGGWHKWPGKYRHPLSLEVVRFAKDHPSEIRFFQWVQWLIDVQLEKAGSALALMQDLPIGVDPDGADAWVWQDALALDATTGAPPDEFNTLGQNWGLPPFIPHKLKETAYRPFRQTIRATLRHSGALRVDHVMGLFRLFWIPKGMEPSQGGYIRYPSRDLLAILALESLRSGAFIVGEDLGTVEPGVPEQLSEHGILSYKVLWFEPSSPSEFPKLALAAVTTHDLPTIAGLWGGSDLEAQRKLGLHPNEAGVLEIRERLRKLTRAPRKAGMDDIIARTYRLLGKAPSMAIAASLEDGLAVDTRPNMPGTVDQWPNWSIPLPRSLEDLQRAPLVHKIAEALRKNRKRKKKTSHS